MEDEKVISFKWNNHRLAFSEVLSKLRSKSIYTDVTLSCEGKFISAHKLILSSCSDYFQELFERTICLSPVIILNDVKMRELEALIDYMYLGETDIKENEVLGVIKAAQTLQIKGLGCPDKLINCDLSGSTDTLNDLNCKLESSEISHSYNSQENAEDYQIKKEPMDITMPEDENVNINGRKKRKLSNVNQRKENNKKLVNKQLPLLKNARKMALTASHKKNSVLRNLNNYNKKLNLRTIRVTAASPKDGQELDLMAIPMNDNSQEPLTFNDNTVQSSDVTNLSDTTLKSENAELLNIESTEDINTSLANNSFINDSISLNDNQTNGINERQRRSNRYYEEVTHVDYSNESEESLTLPYFSVKVQPYLHGEKLKPEVLLELRSCIMNELLEHFGHHELLKGKGKTRTKFYKMLEKNFLNQYPNIVWDPSQRRKGHLGVSSRNLRESAL